jgi:hypothetical protein
VARAPEDEMAVSLATIPSCPASRPFPGLCSTFMPDN